MNHLWFGWQFQPISPNYCLIFVFLLSQARLNWIKFIFWLIHQIHKMSLKIHPWKLLFLGVILTLLNICFCERRLSRNFFYRSQLTKHSTHLSILNSLIPSFSKIYVLVKSGCFTKSRGNKPFSTLWVPNLVIFLTSFFIIWWSFK